MTLVRREKRGSLVQRQAGDEEVHGCQRSSLPAQARVHSGIRIRKPLIWQHDGEVPAERQDATTLLEGFGVELGADEDLSPNEDAHRQRLCAVARKPLPCRSILSTPRLPDGVDKEGRVEVNHQEGSRTGL